MTAADAHRLVRQAAESVAHAAALLRLAGAVPETADSLSYTGQRLAFLAAAQAARAAVLEAAAGEGPPCPSV